MKSNRDDFKQSVKTKLRERVAGRCSKPDCRVQTSGPTQDPEKVNNIWQGPLIFVQRAPGGSRYDSLMKRSERRSIDNGIWLCANHADEIDNDDSKYAIDELLKWKKFAEESAEKELGKKLPDENQAIEMLTTALTGQPKRFPC